MARLSTVLTLLSVFAVSFVAGEDKPEWEQRLDQANKDSACGNPCWFKYFTNKCNSDNPACGCTLKEEREKYLCCLAENCEPHVLFDSLERNVRNCDAWKIPVPSVFDTEAVCGIKVATSSSALPSVTPASSVETSATSAKSTASGTPAASTSSSEPSETEAGPEEPSSSPPGSGASQAVWSGTAVLLASGVFLGLL